MSDRRRELAVEAETGSLAAAPVVGSDAAGFFLRSADSTYQFRLTGLFQADGRFFTGPNQVDTNTFVARRIRPTFQGTVSRYIVRVTPDFGYVAWSSGSSGFPILAAGFFSIRKGQAPFGLERLQSASDLTFIERALPTSLAPNRDEGVQLYGDLLGGGINYAVAAMNGTPDGGSVDNDTNDGKDAVARLFFLPFVKKAATHPLRNFGFGIAGSNGKQEGSLPSFRTTAQSIYFSYVTGATASEHEPLFALALLLRPARRTEYVNSAQDETGDARRGNRVAGNNFLFHWRSKAFQLPATGV
jgi:phosphate-selective porin OprO/OprP